MNFIGKIYIIILPLTIGFGDVDVSLSSLVFRRITPRPFQISDKVDMNMITSIILSSPPIHSTIVAITIVYELNESQSHESCGKEFKLKGSSNNCS